MIRLALGIEYDGTEYCGWQKQKNSLSVQYCVERALKKVSSESITIFCAGRTDSGVHALGQVVHFETNVQREQSAWILGVNHYLPSSICVRWVKPVDKDFHARFSAISRRYCYIIYNSCIRSALLFQKTWHYKKYLDINKMINAAKYLLGENDFSAFRSEGCQSRSTYRRMYHLHVIRKGQYVIIDVKANSFMYHMVRKIVSCLVRVGCGEKPEIWILEVLKSCGKADAVSFIAPSSGLYFLEVKYPMHFSIPSSGVDELLPEY
ncbi:tRNA pseudouridine(38-40) synthase TruA [Candidatus Blochmannia ocreatus (nom. nud.)]|uniref:tRNA pseudouridine synthase A n=1 Tax=Candidatus Blochmannia ocreatus (nom. nud.) TaxID=251538 RepID=A0ABY4SU34_9ENTR|nr:tRNA pseudouridine(38-40) synthase TruA [Candidatus Blochmannia ocreatus]URJ24983.1 tRNA pseudouridine(38-40) synthase TruA [Candidatus Blochmannia ocreatus]